MIMVKLRMLAAFVLLVQMMMVTGTNINDTDTIEEILPKNVSIILVDVKANNTETIIKNVTMLNTESNISNDNNSMILNTLIKKEKRLEAELEEAIEGAAASGQVILISPPVDSMHLTKEPPVIVIETIEAESLKAAINDTSSDKIIEEINPINDQEIVQSRIHKRSVLSNYDNSVNAEDLEDILAIAEYEPQRIDAKKTDEDNSVTSSEETNSLEKTTIPTIEEIHYDVPKRRNIPRKLQRLSNVYTSTTAKPDLKVASTGQVPLATLPSELDPIEIEEKKIKAEKKMLSSPSTFYHKPINVLTESLRDRRHPKIELAPTKSSLPIRLAYGSVPPRLNPLTVSSTLVPNSSENISARLRNNHNLINVAEPLKKKLRTRIGIIPTTIPSNHRSASENETLYDEDKLIDPSTLTSGDAQANRRIDYYLTPQYLESLKPKSQPLTNEQLGYLTRYNLPSLLTGKSRSRPVAARQRQTGNLKQLLEDNPGIPNSRKPRIITHVRDSYDLQGRKIVNKPTTVGYDNERRTPKVKATPIYNSYEEAEEATKPSHQPRNEAYQRNRHQPQTSTLPTYDSDEEDHKETAPNHQVEKAAYQRNRNQQLSSTPADNSSEEDDEETASKDRQVENSAYRGNRNQELVSTTPFYDFYEDYKQTANTKIANASPTSSYEDYKESAENLKTVKNVPESSYEDYKESESSKTDKNSPTTSYDDYNNSAENVKIVSDSPESYEDYKESESTKTDRNSPTTSYDDYRNSGENAKLTESSSAASYEDSKESEENSKITRNTSAASYEDSKESDENSKTARNSPVSSYEDYEESDKSKNLRNSKESIALSTPVDDSYEDYKESQSAKLLKKSPIVPSTAAYNSYESYEESDEGKVTPQQQKSISSSAEQRKRLPIISHPVSTNRPNDYSTRTIHPVTPISVLNNPIYQLHGLKTTAIPVKGLYNPYANYSTRKPSRVASYDRQNGQVPRATVTSQRIVSTTPAYDSYEDTAQTNNPSVTIPRITSPNYLDHRIAKPSYNGDKNIENVSIAPIKKNLDYAYRQNVGSPYTVIPSNTISPLPPQGILQPQRNLHRTISKVSSPTHVKTIDNSNEYDESIVRIPYVKSETRKLRGPKSSQYRETNNQPTSLRPTPEYDSYESDDREISPSPASRSQLNVPHLADYGNRIRTRVAEKRRDRVVAPSNLQASSTTPTRRRNVKTSTVNYENRRPTRTHKDGLPVESVNRPNARVSSDYEDEVPAGSGHEEKHENYETHEAAKKKHEGDHKHEEGGGEKHEEEHHGSHGEKGDKGYKEWHEHDKGEKGHHDKESHDKEYEEKEGEKKKHEEESDYHKEHHHEEKGDKEAEFGEKGEHQKGHSTKGQHVIHKKDEFEKKTEFYDESHEEDGEEKEGEHHEHHEHEKGGHEKIGHYDSAHHKEKHGKKGEHEKGHHYHDHKGHKKSDGHDEHHHHEEKYGKKGGHEEGKKWSHKKGDNGKKDS